MIRLASNNIIRIRGPPNKDSPPGPAGLSLHFSELELRSIVLHLTSQPVFPQTSRQRYHCDSNSPGLIRESKHRRPHRNTGSYSTNAENLHSHQCEQKPFCSFSNICRAKTTIHHEEWGIPTPPQFSLIQMGTSFVSSTTAIHGHPRAIRELGLRTTNHRTRHHKPSKNAVSIMIALQSLTYTSKEKVKREGAKRGRYRAIKPS